MTDTVDPKAERRSMAFVFVTVLIDSIGFGVVIPVFPSLIMSLTGQPLAQAAETAGWIMFLYAGTQFLCGPVIGGLSDRFGRRPVLLASLTAFGIDYAVAGFAPTIWWLVAARLVAGVTGASFSTRLCLYRRHQHAGAAGPNFGLIGMAFGLGFIIGPALGGLVSVWGPRAPFYLSAALAFSNVAYGWFVLPESLKPENRRPFDWRRANPVGSLLRLKRAKPVVLVLAVTVFLWTLSYQSLYTVWNYFTILRFDWTPRQVGWSLGAVGVIGAIVQGVLSRRLIPRFGARNIIIAGALSGMAGFTIYSFAGVGWMMYVGILAQALTGLVFPSLQGMMSSSVGPSEQGELQGSVSSIQSLTSIIGPPLMTGTFARFSGADAAVYFPGAPFLLSALFAVAALAMFFRAVAMGAGAAAAPEPGASAARGDPSAAG